MDIKKSTELYEEWIGEQTKMSKDLLQYKHRQMKLSAFHFFRGSFYHWAQLWAEQAKNTDQLPLVLSVADIHYENFGTWRDAEARLVWGINDFDEAYKLPFTHDLVRLACSISIGIDIGILQIKKDNAIKAIIEGYKNALEHGRKPFVLEENHTWLRKIATSKLKDPQIFWNKIQSNKPANPPEYLQNIMISQLPELEKSPLFLERISGLGSLGRERFIALAQYNGGYICREAKATVPSAFCWVYNTSTETNFYHQMIQQKAIRSSALLLSFESGWQIKKLSPDHSRIELTDLPKSRNEEKVLFAMGFELANIHANNKDIAKNIEESLFQLPKKWLGKQVAQFSDRMIKDYKKFCKN